MSRRWSALIAIVVGTALQTVVWLAATLVLITLPRAQVWSSTGASEAQVELLIDSQLAYALWIGVMVGLLSTATAAVATARPLRRSRGHLAAILGLCAFPFSACGVLFVFGTQAAELQVIVLTASLLAQASLALLRPSDQVRGRYA